MNTYHIDESELTHFIIASEVAPVLGVKDNWHFIKDKSLFPGWEHLVKGDLFIVFQRKTISPRRL